MDQESCLDLDVLGLDRNGRSHLRRLLFLRHLPMYADQLRMADARSQRQGKMLALYWTTVHGSCALLRHFHLGYPVDDKSIHHDEGQEYQQNLEEVHLWYFQLGYIVSSL